MSRPSVNAIRRAGVAGALGAGLALLGISLAGIASLDSDLRAASQQPQRPAARDHRVSFEQRRPGACHRPDAAQQDQPRWKPAPAPASLPTT